MEANVPALLEDDVLEEVYWGDLLPNLPHMQNRQIRSEWDLIDLSQSSNLTKSLPYFDQHSLEKMQSVGFRLWRDPNVQTAIKALTTYVVYKGWWYAISVREGQEYTPQKLALIKSVHTDLIENVSLGTQRGWFFLQQESYIRFLRDGEFFRRWFIPDGTLQVRFIEVNDIRQPPSMRNVINRESLPFELLAQLDPKVPDEPPGELGIVTMPGDAATEIGYWHRIRLTRDDLDDRYEFLPSTRVQHAKCDVDSNDPRGVPAFYDAVCPTSQAQDVAEAMNELAVKQSKYGVVVKHKAMNRREAIQGLVSAKTREMNDQMSTMGRSPHEHHLKNADIEMHAMKAQARNYVEVIQQDQRTIGGMRQIPEFMISNDANTGNRSSLLAATSPFGRRVATDQKQLWFYDQQLQWNAIVSLLDWQEATAMSAKRRVQITVTFPISESKDPEKDARTQIELREDGVISRQEQRRRLDIDHPQMEQELAAENTQTPEGGNVFVSPNKIVRQTADQNTQIPQAT
jgi:hypothetical protein